jgi:hypothetical protein
MQQCLEQLQALRASLLSLKSHGRGRDFYTITALLRHQRGGAFDNKQQHSPRSKAARTSPPRAFLAESY